MNTLVIILVAVLAAALGVLAMFLLVRRRGASDTVEAELNNLPQRLDAFKDALGSRFSQEVSQIRQEMAAHLGQNREAVERSGQHLSKQLMEFTAGVTQMSGALREVKESMKEVASFQDILRTPKLRGQWGEASLEHLLAEFFPQDVFEMQKKFKNGEAVDAALKLPDGKMVPIDSKFPLENFQRMVLAESEPDKIKFRKLFVDDAEREIDSVAAKYIVPAEGTTDFALLFIPAESVYYELMNNLRDEDVADYARKKRILLVSPNTLYLTLQVLQRWMKDVKVSRETQMVIKKLSQIIRDAEKLSEDFRVLGGHLDKAKGAYDQTEKRLSLMADRTQNLLASDEAALLVSEGKQAE